MPTLWFRNTWSWDADEPRPSLREVGPGVIQASHRELGEMWLHCDGSPGPALHREREQRLPAVGPAQCDPVREGCASTSTSSRAARRRSIPPRPVPRRRPTTSSRCPAAGARRSALRLAATAACRTRLAALTRSFESRLADADEFYDRISPTSLSEDERRVHRQALAGMLWSKQYYYFDLDRWLQDHESHPLLESTRRRPEHGMVPHAERGRDLDAGQVGVPVVCGLGPRLPHRVAGAGGLRFCQGAAPVDAPQSVCPPERADSRPTSGISAM